MPLQRLTDTAGNTVEFGPQQESGYREDRIADISRWRSRAGNLYTYRWFTDKWKYIVPIFTQVAADANQLNTWRKNNIPLTFSPDLLNMPTVTRTVHIINDEDPMQWLDPQWKTNYQGVLILEEV